MPVGEHPGPGGVKRSPGKLSNRAWLLFRRLRGYEAQSLQLVECKDNLLAPVTLLEVSKASQPRKAANFGHRESQKDCGPVLLDSFRDVQAHSFNHAFGQYRKHAVVQTSGGISPSVSIRKRQPESTLAQCAYFLTQRVQRFGTDPGLAGSWFGPEWQPVDY